MAKKPTYPATVDARPVKSFFVEMLTRDISLQDAILDLLDNSVDGIQRTATKATLRKRTPYNGYWARISFSGDGFAIEDNCGGIPWKLSEYAWRMGRIKKDFDKKDRRAVGTYGIGMKRAIFKIGEDCTITTHSSDRSYKVYLSPKWMKSESDWGIPASAVPSAKTRGTSIRISKIHPAIRNEFDSDRFQKEFRAAVATHYAYIIDKGFDVYVNDALVKPRSIRLLFSTTKEKASLQHEIRPFVYETKHEGVEVFLAVGFTRPIPSTNEANESLENYKDRYSSGEAGWTIICNDRTVVYRDKTALTGWGVSGVPQYHPQFIAISGIVIFSSEDANLLPTTTTKRGIEASSELYLQIRDKMIEGMKLFTQYTNQWKGMELVAKSKSRLKQTTSTDLAGVMRNVSRLPMKPTRGVLKGKQYKPTLPRPTQEKTSDRIAFRRPVAAIRRVSSYLFGTRDKKPSVVGEKCFDLVLEETEE